MALIVALLAPSIGCRSGAATRVAAAGAEPLPAAVEPATYDEPVDETDDGPIETAPEAELPALEETDEAPLRLPEVAGEADFADAAEVVPAGEAVSQPSVEALVVSVRRHFPLIQQAVAARTIASGETLAAWGAFDHKLDGYSNSQPQDFYKNYWHNVGLKRDTYWGGEVYAGYRLGRGVYEPWYLERETNKGGEFKAGFVAPLAQDRGIDANRAELWRAQLERDRIEPEIRSLVIGSVRDATIAYWAWVAAAENYRIADGVLQLGLNRVGFLDRQIELGEKASIDAVDNQRIVVSRRAKLIDARRKLEQSAIKLSLFFRDDLGTPMVFAPEAVEAKLPVAPSADLLGEAADIALAQANRPELEDLRIAERQLAVLLRQANNETRPRVDAGVAVAQDVGEPTSSKRDKSEFELEATLMLSVPLERRKAIGKARQLRGKIAQLRAKTRFASDKITVEAQAAHAALVAAAERVTQTTEGVALAQQMQAAEKRLYELGQSTLFNLNFREQQAAEAASDRVAALFDYHVAAADYAAALGLESVVDLEATLQL